MMPSGTDAHQFKVSTHVCNKNALLYSRLYKRVVSDITVGTSRKKVLIKRFGLKRKHAV